MLLINWQIWPQLGITLWQPEVQGEAEAEWLPGRSLSPKDSQQHSPSTPVILLACIHGNQVWTEGFMVQEKQ